MAPFGDSDADSETDESSDEWTVEERGDAAGSDQADRTVRLDPATITDDDPHGTLKRAVDEEAGVVVYAYKNGNAGGLTAVPVEETDLAVEE